MENHCLFLLYCIKIKRLWIWYEPLNPDKGFWGFWMSKYETSIKIKVIKEYEKNNISQSELSKKYKIPQTTISNWIKMFYVENYSSYEK